MRAIHIPVGQLASWLIDEGVFFLHTKGKANSSSSLHNFQDD
jgi:hypothetical protein